MISHFLSKMFLEYSEATSRCRTDSVPWVMHVLPVLRQDRHTTQYLSVLALAVDFFARVHKNVALQGSSARIYGQALRLLVDDIGSLRVDDWCLASTGPLCLCLYELVTASEPLAWLQHSGGIAAVVSLFPLRLGWGHGKANKDVP